MPNDYGDGNNWTDMKKNGATSEEFDELQNLWHGYYSEIGPDDRIDYVQFQLTSPAKLSFTIEASTSVKFTLYQLTGKPGKYSLKTLQTSTTKKNTYYDYDYEGEVTNYQITTSPYFFTDATEDDPINYYFSVQAVNSKAETDYSIYLNESQTYFFTDIGDDGNNWTDMKKNGANSEELGELDLYSMYEDYDFISSWVGYGDAVDYRRFTVSDIAKLSFTVNSTDKTKVTLYKLTGSPGKYSLKSLASSSSTERAKPTPYYDEEDGEWYYDEEWDMESWKGFTATTKSVLVDAGEYYLCVESTNAKKGGSASYDLFLNAGGSSLFDRGNNEDDWKDMKKNGAESEQLGEFNPYYMAYDGEWIGDWVGMGDEVDYRRFSIDGAAKLSFTVCGTDAMKVSICKLTGRAGNYSLKALQTTTIQKLKTPYQRRGDEGETYNYDYAATTKGLLLEEAGEYYLCVESTNAKKGGSAGYNIFYNSADSSFYNQGNNEDDWTDMKQNGAASEQLKSVNLYETFYYDEEFNGGWISVGDDEYENSDSNWVGMGDEVDYRRFTVDGAAMLTLSFYASDATKFSVFKLTGSENRYSLTPLLTATSSKLKTPYQIYDYESEYSFSYVYGATSKTLLLEDPGEYYFCVESTNAKKGGNAGYRIRLDSATFFASDDGWNNQLVDKSKKLVEAAQEGGELDLHATEITDMTQEILLDREDIEHYEWIADDVERTWHNFVGFGDDTDIGKITLENTAKLSFTVEATDAAKFVIYSLAPGKKDTYTQKALQTTTLTKKTETYTYWGEVYNPATDDFYEKEITKNYTYYATTTKAIQLAAGDYYIAVISTNAKNGGNAYYNVSLNADGCSNLPEGFIRDLVVSENADDGWNNFLYDKKMGLNPNMENFVTTVIQPDTGEILLDNSVDVNGYRNYVGYGDDADYARFELDFAAKLSFTVSSTDAVKFSVCQFTLNDKGAFSLDSLATATLTAGGTVSTTAVMLEAGVYYLSMESTNARKGGDAYYNVSMNASSAFFVDADDGRNNFVYDSKRSYLNPNAADFVTNVVSSGNQTLLLDYNQTSRDEWNNFVGFGDAADYAKIIVNNDCKLSFMITATDAAKFTVSQLVQSMDKKGNVVYNLKELQSTDISKPKGITYSAVSTRVLNLSAGEYYISMQSTNAAEGGSVYYNVEVEVDQFSSSVASALSQPADALADASATNVLGQDDGLLRQTSALLA